MYALYQSLNRRKIRNTTPASARPLISVFLPSFLLSSQGEPWHSTLHDPHQRSQVISREGSIEALIPSEQIS